MIVSAKKPVKALANGRFRPAKIGSDGATKRPANQSSNAARSQAAALIARWLVEGDFPSLLLEDVREHRAFCMELIYGVVRWKRLLDWVVDRYVQRVPDPSRRAFLLVGLYQILQMNDVASYAAVHATVEAAKTAHGMRQADFVNAILRRTLREKDALLLELARQPLGIRQSHPEILVKRWMRRFGVASTESLCAWNNQRADVIIRVNQLKITPGAYGKTLAPLVTDGRIKPHTRSACFTLAHGMRVFDLPGYAEGHYMVMDPAASQAVDLLDPLPGDHVLDACAAPGGKTALIAERLRLKGQLVAMDLRADRLPRLRANLERLGCAHFAKVVQGDARRLRPESFGCFDRILLDVPCSNTGVIRRKPDVRWRFSNSGLKRLGVVQRELLDNAAGLLKRPGCIVYSTCSLEPEENELMVASWLKTHPGFCPAVVRQSFPPASGQDGAYAVLLTIK